MNYITKFIFYLSSLFLSSYLTSSALFLGSYVLSNVILSFSLNYAGINGPESSHSEINESEPKISNVTIRKKAFGQTNSAKFRSQSAIFSSHHVSEYHAAGYTERKRLSFCGRLKDGHAHGTPLLCPSIIDGVASGHGHAAHTDRYQDSGGKLKSVPVSVSVSAPPSRRVSSSSTYVLESSAAVAAVAAKAATVAVATTTTTTGPATKETATATTTTLRPVLLTSILPFEDTDDTRYISPDSESPKTPNTRSSGSAFPNLDPGSRPSNLLITTANIMRLGSNISHPVTHFDDYAEEGISSRSRQNSDGSENYDVLLGIGNNFSLDYDDSNRMIRLNANGDVTADSGDNSPGDPFGFARSSSGGSKIRTRNRPSSIVLRSLGFAAKGNITPQQLQILLRMRELLRTGVDVLKHGRGGKPKKRVLFCESEFSKLCWRKPCVLR